MVSSAYISVFGARSETSSTNGPAAEVLRATTYAVSWAALSVHRTSTAAPFTADVWADAKEDQEIVFQGKLEEKTGTNIAVSIIVWYSILFI